MTIGFDLGHDLDLEFSRSNMDFAISQSKMVRLPRNKKQTYRLISRPQMWPSGSTLDMTLTLNFQGQIWNWLYLCQKWSDCHKTKSKHIDWTLGLKCDHQIWPWLWPWPWIFKVKYEFLYISTKTGPIATNRKAKILIWTLGLKYDQWVWPWPWPWINIWILKVICDLDSHRCSRRPPPALSLQKVLHFQETNNNLVFLIWLHFYNPTLYLWVPLSYLSSHTASVV